MDHGFSCLRFRSKALVLDQTPTLVCIFSFQSVCRKVPDAPNPILVAQPSKNKVIVSINTFPQ